MKNFYILALASLSSFTVHAQLTLEKQWHEPVAGEQSGIRAYDSTAAIPKQTGSGITWDFSSLVQNAMGATASTFVLPTAVPASSMFPGTTLVESKNGEYTYFKSGSSPDVFEGLGYQSSLATVNYSTDAMTIFTWPISYGASYTDTYSGGISGPFNGNLTGTLQTVASGEGTLILPGSDKFTNVLQLRSTQTASIGTSGTITNISYSYFHSTQKFPLVNVNYFRMTGPTGSIFTYSVFVNKNLAVGITDQNFESQVTLYPNPTGGKFTVKLSAYVNDNCTVKVYNNNGALVRQSKTQQKVIDETIDISDLQPGIYFVKVQAGDRSGTKKMIIQ